MNKNITQNDLVLFAYNELEEPRRQEVELALSLDQNLESQYLDIIETQIELNSGLKSPHPTSLQIILEESASAMEVA